LNYYKRHLGDYAKNTRTLNTYEHGVYNLVLDLYYTDEGPVSTKDAYSICRADSAKDRGMVDNVLSKFFILEDSVWRHGRADEEIAKYREKSEKNKAIGSLGGKQKAKRNAREMLSETPQECLADDNPSHKPLANIEQKIPATPAASASEPPDPIFGAGLDFLRRKGLRESTARSFLGLLRKELHDDLTTAELLGEAERQDVSNPQAWLSAAAKRRKGEMHANHISGGQSRNLSVVERIEQNIANRKRREAGEREAITGVAG